MSEGKPMAKTLDKILNNEKCPNDPCWLCLKGQKQAIIAWAVEKLPKKHRSPKLDNKEAYRNFDEAVGFNQAIDEAVEAFKE